MSLDNKIRVQNTYYERFQAIVDQLNDAQLEAVSTLEGPVLVLAGPGTGKTHVLAARIGQILLQTDVSPYNILCLTYTDAGVLAMRKRLIEFIGPEAHRVHIFSFHSFCNKIIQENLDLFGHHDLMPVSEVERLELLEELIDELPYENPLKKGKSFPYFYLAHLQHLFSLIKMENWQEKEINEKAQAFLAGLPNRDEYRYKINTGRYRKGDLKAASIRQKEQEMESLMAGVSLFERYENKLKERKRYDYEDMILWVLKAFSDHPFLLRRYQEQYLYLLVDEFQDTNGSQNALLDALVDYWEHPNLFIVGDDDQAIYEFQGARLRHITNFYEKYKKGITRIVLQENYRSSQGILDFSADLIKRNQLRVGSFFPDITKELQSKTGISTKPLLRVYSDRQQENAGVFAEIEALLDSGVSPASIAVLYARHKQAASLMQLFDKKGLPYKTKRNVDILSEPIILQLITVLSYFAKEWDIPFSGDALIFEVMHYPFFGISTSDIGRLAKYKQGDNNFSWREILIEGEIPEDIQLENDASFSRFKRFFSDFLQWGIRQPLPRLLEKAVNGSGMLTMLLEQQQADRHVQMLYQLYRFTGEECQKNPDLDLTGLLSLFDRMKKNSIPLSIQPREGVEGAVLFSSAHSAKGLEFDYVFMIDCVKDAWESGRQGGSRQFSFPDTLTYSREEDAEEAKRRLFYVAATRAKKHLYISYSQKKDTDGKGLIQSIFVDEFFQRANVPETTTDLPDQEFQPIARLFLQEESPFVPVEESFLKELLDGFKLSVSSLDSYLDCPLAFYYRYLLKVPVLATESSLYGQAVHHALHIYFKKMLRDKQRDFPPVDELLNEFEVKMRSFSNLLSKRAFEFRLAQGKKNLKSFAQKNTEKWEKEVWLEYWIGMVELEGVPLEGTIDKVERLAGGKAILVDYKTGRPGYDKFKAPSDTQPYGGSYWRQLLFYKILFEQLQDHAYVVNQGIILSTDPDYKGEFPVKKLLYESSDIIWMKNLIKEVWKKIHQTTVFEGCGKPSCKWCAVFIQRNFDYSLADLSKEELDD